MANSMMENPTLATDQLLQNKLLMAFVECSDELRAHAVEMIRIIVDSQTEDTDRVFAQMTLADILFPNTHEGDRKLGMDLAEMETLARNTDDEARATLDAMDRQEETFADRVTHLMNQLGLTQTALAEKVGLRQSAISMILSRQCRPQRRTVRKLAEALQVSPTELWPDFTEE
jgi:lambda repressor-like predicted transcriptional regulator